MSQIDYGRWPWRQPPSIEGRCAMTSCYRRARCGKFCIVHDPDAPVVIGERLPVYVYIIAAPAAGLMKIGRSISPQDRLKAFETEHKDFGPLSLFAIAEIQDWGEETKFHDHMKEFTCLRTGFNHREWFYMNDASVSRALKWLDEKYPKKGECNENYSLYSG